jgi:DNA-binding response OmpR family regulator
VRLLIVDDDVLIREIYQSVLSASGYLVDVAGDLPTTEWMLQQLIPDYLLLDLMMRPKSGWEILMHLKQNQKSQNLPVILFSGKVVYAHEIRRYGEEVIGYIRKPTRLPDIIQEIARVSSCQNDTLVTVEKAASAGFSNKELIEFSDLLLNIPVLDKLVAALQQNFRYYGEEGKDSGPEPDPEMEALLFWIEEKKMRRKVCMERLHRSIRV